MEMRLEQPEEEGKKREKERSKAHFFCRTYLDERKRRIERRKEKEQLTKEEKKREKKKRNSRDDKSFSYSFLHSLSFSGSKAVL